MCLLCTTLTRSGGRRSASLPRILSIGVGGQVSSYLHLGIILAALVFAPAVSAQNLSAPVTGSRVTCEAGAAAGFGCEDVDLLAFLPIASITGPSAAKGGPITSLCHDEGCHAPAPGVVELNDIWGWTDPVTGSEYALVGRTDGMSIVNVTDPLNPVYLGNLPSHTSASAWRDIKVYQNHAFAVADNVVGHGMQVFDLTRLRGLSGPPVTFTEDAHYPGFNRAHNLAINEETGFAYAVGTETCGAPGTKQGGLHMVAITSPEDPQFAGCFFDPRTGLGGSGYTHDVQCVIYRGPDVQYANREICFGSNETALSVADVTDKAESVAISATPYPDVQYSHQGWLTEDHRFFLVNDELDEIRGFAERTRTIVMDVSDLDAPKVHAEYFSPVGSTDHNLYVVGNYVFQANYKSGLRILSIADIGEMHTDAAAVFQEAYFDTYPPDDETGFDGAWSVYPYFESGTVAVSSMGQGLFLLKPTSLSGSTGVPPQETPYGFALAAVYPNPFRSEARVDLEVSRPQEITVAAYDLLGREVAVLHQGVLSADTHRIIFNAAGLPSGLYVIRALGEEGALSTTVALSK